MTHIAPDFRGSFRSAVRGMSPYRAGNLSSAGNLHGTGASELTEDQLRQAVPSIFAEDKHASRSDRYRFIPTFEVVRGLREEGFVPTFATERRDRTGEKHGKTKHLVRFRHMGDDASRDPQHARDVVLVNSHDGSSAYNLLAGVFRFICLNGMISADEGAQAVKVHHSGDVVRKVIDGTYEVLGESRKAVELAQDWRTITVRDDDAMAFARAAHGLRFEPNADGEVQTAIQPAQLLLPRRTEDRAPDLWTRFNVVQEHCIRGGLQAVRRRPDGSRRHETARAVNGIDGNVRLNQALWTLTQHFANHVRAAA